MAVIRGTALTNFHQPVTELGGNSRTLVANHIPYGDVGGAVVFGHAFAGRPAGAGEFS
jgi:hypothetical protein